MLLSVSAYALTGRSLPLFVTQGVATLALGYVLAALSGRSGPMYDTPPIAITFVPKAKSIRNTKCGLRHKNVATSCEKNYSHPHFSPPWEGKAVNLALLASDSALADKARGRSDKG